MTETTTGGAMRLREALTIPEVVSASDFVLQLHTGVQAAASTVDEYVVTDALAGVFDEALGFVDKALTTGADRGVFVHGSFGSGKSHFMAILDLLLRGEPAARALPGLQSVLAKHAGALEARLLTVEYHLIGAQSLEQALFSGYLTRVAALHPEESAPLLHRSDALFDDAARIRAMNAEAFFAQLNSGAVAADGGQWGAFATAWDAATYDSAAAAAVDDPARVRLTQDLVATVLTGYATAGEWLAIDQGLAVMATHAKSLGYQGITLFLDELVLWLASHLSDRAFVSSEGAKVAKLVESGIGARAVPLVSFVARQRDLVDFLGDSTSGVLGGAVGAERLAVGDTFSWWEERFDPITLQASDLPEIAHRRLLTPRDPDGAAAIAGAVARLKANRASWDALLTDEAGSDEAMFAQVYPFSPALVDTLVGLSNLLQRERTALKVMAQLLVAGRETLTVNDVIPVGDLYDAMVAGGDTPLTDQMRQYFAVARALYLDKLRPVLLVEHGLTEEALPALARAHPFHGDDRLAKTLLVAAIAPGVAALKNLTAGRLAALNHGSVAVFVPGTESAAVLDKVRRWAQSVGELHVGEGHDPVISVQLTGVDYDGVLERVAGEDTDGARRQLLKKLVFAQLVVDADGMFGTVTKQVMWRGTKRSVEVVFGNVRDSAAMPDDLLRASGEGWKVVVDYPFDEAGYSPQDDVNRFATLRAAGVSSRTVGWVPRFLTRARQDDLGKLVLLEYLLAGTGEQFDRNATYLPVDQRPVARQLLDNQRQALRGRLADAIKQAYGVTARIDTDIDTSHGDVDTFPTLDASLTVQPPVGATLGDAFTNLVDQLLSSQYPEHPRFDPGSTEVRRADLAVVLDHVTRAVTADGRVDPVESSKRGALRRVANPLECGECYENHYVFSAAQFPWRNRFLRWAADTDLSGEIGVQAMRGWLAPYGLTRDVGSLLIAAWALLEDKQFARHGATVRVLRLEDVTDDLVLRDPALPDPAVWDAARERAARVFGLQAGAMRTAANVADLAGRLREHARTATGPCRDLQAALSSHTGTLALTPDAPRLVSARLGAELSARLAAESDDMVVLAALAEHALPAETEPLARSIASAEQVRAALAGAQWTVLDAVASRVGDEQAQAILAPLREAARFDEAHSALGGRLAGAGAAAASHLASISTPTPTPAPAPSAVPVPTPTPVPPPGATLQELDAITLDGLDDQVTGLADQIRAALRANPGKQARVRWWLE